MRPAPLSLFLFVVLLLSSSVPTWAQQSVFKARVIDEHEREALFGVNVAVEGTTIGGATDSEGLVTISGIPSGKHTIVFSFVGYETVKLTVTFPTSDPDFLYEIALEESHEELEEVSVSATRTSRTIADQATRVETIAGEEIEEKISMEPGNISMLLNESPGINVQQTSAVTGGSSIQIQGLDGRYTQILKDGFPLFGGFSGGLSLLQVPPLDLQQVEVIKGPSSILYGGDAIAGLINLVSKGPTEDSQLSLLANATTAGGIDLGSFYTNSGERFGITFLATGNNQRPYDPDDDSFANLPKTSRVTLNPKLYYYPNASTTLSLGISGTVEERTGGDMEVLNNGASSTRTFFEENSSTRLSSQFRVDRKLNGSSTNFLKGDGVLTFKNSVSFFDRKIEVPGYQFEGQQIATYSEASLLVTRSLHQISLGVDVRSDAFEEALVSQDENRDYTYVSSGVFIQDTWDVNSRVVLEAGTRVDYHNEYGTFVLPKASVLFRATDQLSARVGGGLGYKAPTVFLEPSEERAFRGVRPLSNQVEAETSNGGSVDINYRTLIRDKVVLTLNQAFYFTKLKNPLIPVFEDNPIGLGSLEYKNADGSMQTQAFETNAKIAYGDLKLFLGYVHLKAEMDKLDGPFALPLTPTHKTYTVLVYEKHGKGRIGLEAYYTGPQRLTDDSKTKGYWITGIMAERKFGPASFFLNFENMLDTKQSNFSPVVLGDVQNPHFADIWAPMDGFIVNGGVKYTL